MDSALQSARAYWHGLAQLAVTQHKYGVPPQCVAPRKLLKHTPSIPDNRIRDPLAPLDTFSSNGVLFVRAQATWSASKESDCGVGGRQKTRAASLAIGVRQPASTCLGNEAFCASPSQEDGPSSRRNMVGVLTLGWLYIFSAEMVDRRLHENAAMAYTHSRAEVASLEGGVHGVVDIGDVDEQAARWWSAILAPDQGWKATIFQNDEDPFVSPWSVAMDDKQRLKIRWSKHIDGLSSAEHPPMEPPSARRALDLLIQFCELHGIQSQLFAAIPVAMNLPIHNCYGISATLPSPIAEGHVRLPEVPDVKAAELYEQIPYYMALSCNFQIIISSLCGVFWEPDVPCNLVSPWLHPVLNELRETLASNASPSYTETLCAMCALRCPNLAALWLGATLSGLSPMIVEFIGSGTPPLDPCASAWTSCPQSFMDVAGSGAYAKPTASGTKISRADAWRLLYFPPIVDDDLHYDSPPFSPWEPVGATTFEVSAIRVHMHRDCPRHSLTYRHWSWIRKDGSTTDDEGFDPSIIADHPRLVNVPARIEIIPQSLPNQDASMAASQEVFGWVTSNCEGHPPESIYSDRWLQEGETSEEYESADGSSFSNDDSGEDAIDDNGAEVGFTIQKWIAGID